MRRFITRTFRRLDSGQRGFTLVELLISVAIMAGIGSGLVGALYQMNTFTSRGVAQLATESDLRISMQWLNKDLQRARTTDLADGGLPVVCSSMVTSTPCVTFTWQNEYEGVSTNHSASYSLVGNELLRTFDSSTHAVARRVEDVSFSQVGKLITVTMTSTDEGWADISKEFTHHFFMSSS